MPTSSVTVYWRPACGFCMALFRSLDRAGIRPERRNIWEDEDAADFVRSVADGNEVVPTVAIGDRALVNPSGAEVMRALAEVTPAEVRDDDDPPTAGPVTRAIHRMLGGSSS